MILVSLAPADPAIAKGRKCLEYDPAIVRLTGIIRRHADVEPPRYGDGPNDVVMHYWRLHLDRPICVNGDGELDAPESEGAENIRELQIVYRDYPKGPGWVGHRVAITGKLFHGITAYHHTEVLIEAKKTERLR